MADSKLSALPALTGANAAVDDLLYIDDVSAAASKSIRRDELFSSTPPISIGGSDVVLTRDAAGVLAQRNSTNAQTFNLYNTYTDASNYERGYLKWNANVLQLGTEAAGTGTSRRVTILGTTTFSISGFNYFSLHSTYGQVSRSDTGYGWASSTDSTGTPDTGLSRVSSGVVGVGTGAAASVAGTLSLNAVILSKTITTPGTTGAQTINKSSGRVNFAAAAASLVVTNSLVTANSIIQCTVATNDATMKAAQVVAGSGSFTIYASANPTAETAVNFTVTN